jgi:hypothetical protein
MFRSEVMWAEEGFCDDFDLPFLGLRKFSWCGLLQGNRAFIAEDMFLSGMELK